MCDLGRFMLLSRAIETVRDCGETVRNVEIWWQEHEDTQKDSELAKHLKNNPIHLFSWKVPFPASSNRRIGQNMEASIIALK